ncbi:MAG TPA: (2Fe-2S)-binding protein, partial [Bradyrhizobium sp.]|nr:(2Fe-2S)-binding protein [Bradyrhizobium sp.]
DLAEDEPVRYTIIDRAPRYHLRDAPWGTQYAGYRPAGPDTTYWRFANFLFPFWTQAPNGEFSSHMHARGWVPLDDAHTMFVFIWWKKAVSAMSLPQPAFKDGTPIGGTGRGNKFLPNTSDWLGRFRLEANPDNDWRIDRAAQQSGAIYSGIDGIHLQDQAITESMGPIVDHAWEHLAPSDQMITRTRRRLLMAARALRDQGIAPPGAEDASVYRAARSGYFVSDDKSEWQQVYANQVAAGVHPPRLHAAE